jgi:hypothetical protein
VDLGQRRAVNRELNNGAGDALSRAFELVLTPIIFGALGLFIDGRLGTRPAFGLTLFLFTLGYIVWKFTVRYAADMREHEAELLGRREGGAPHGS